MKRRIRIAVYTTMIVILVLCASLLDNLTHRRYVVPEMEKFNTIMTYISSYYVDKVPWDKIFQVSIDAVFSELDPHSAYIPPRDVQLNEENFQGRYEGIGIQFDIIEDTLTVIAPMAGSPAELAGMLAGDRIVAIDDQSAIGISNDEVTHRLKGPKGSKVRVEVKRRHLNASISLTITRDEIPITSINTYFILRDDIGYVSLNRFAQNTDRELDEALNRLHNIGMQRLIFDLRWNAGGYLDQAVKVAARFIGGKKMIVETRGRLPEFNERFMTDDFGEHPTYDIPLIVLINHGSASASEIVAGAIQDYDRGLLAGTPSFGKGLVQREYPLADNSRLRLTISKYYTPSGRLIQRPYKDKTFQEYYSESVMDTIMNDSLVFYTASGRTVYGRGGIMPDTLLKQNDDDTLIMRMNRERIFFEIAADFAQTHQDLKNNYSWYIDSFFPDEGLINQSLRLAGRKGITDVKNLDRQTKDKIGKQLKIEIARGLWDSERYYQVAMVQDSTVQIAGTLFPFAEELMDSEKGVKKRN